MIELPFILVQKDKRLWIRLLKNDLLILNYMHKDSVQCSLTNSLQGMLHGISFLSPVINAYQ